MELGTMNIAAIRIQGELGEWVDMQKGVWQGCILSLDLFKLYCGEALTKISTCEGAYQERTNYNNLRCANDKALVADSEESFRDC